MQKIGTRRKTIAALAVLMFLLLAFLAVNASAATVDTEILPDTTTIPEGTNSPFPPEPRASDPTPMPTVEDGGMSGGVWGILIAVGIAALAVAMIFLFLPRSGEGREERERRRR